MTKDQLREALISIIIKASTRGRGHVTPTRGQAAEVLDHLVSSDTHPDWQAVGNANGGRDLLRRVIGHYRSLEA